MLNPSRQLRLKVQQVEKHSWVLSSYEETFEDVSRDWKSQTTKRIAKDFKLGVDEVAAELEGNPFGQLGGAFNIEKHLHQINTIALKKRPSCLRLGTVKVINQISPIYPSQISTLPYTDSGTGHD